MVKAYYAQILGIGRESCFARRLAFTRLRVTKLISAEKKVSFERVGIAENSRDAKAGKARVEGLSLFLSLLQLICPSSYQFGS